MIKSNWITTRSVVFHAFIIYHIFETIIIFKKDNINLSFR